MRYRLSDEAEEDLIDAFLYGIATFGVRQAERYRDALEYVFQLIADNPRLGRKVDDDDAVRRFHHGRHVIIYRIESDELIIVSRLFHDAMDIDQLLK